ncbi:MAG: Uncharacterized protein FD162_2860 [Rhodobacteraceae bacterium]|uniref:hypothetical protein n=1 Tax=Cypionkella sp. TaxID=2811411 RepID=UPI0013214C0D|nr:hypothetical protein [Cypionkella sp.]KAF0171776.1 MAG: Uncharacterized protein FD162_2860 [Paracoccaceae bacterium]MDO8327743.1 hypothetical protein [Cypionkella sp.]
MQQPARQPCTRLGLLLLIGCAALALFPGAALAAPPALDEAKAQATCAEQWTKRGQTDKQMFRYCMTKQREGHDRATDLYRKYSTIKSIDAIVRYASEKWLTRREYQYDMVAYEIEKQGEAFLDVAFDYNAKKYSDPEVEACIGKWIRSDEPQWDMVAYCLKNGR